jgi:hypothetical protein
MLLSFLHELLSARFVSTHRLKMMTFAPPLYQRAPCAGN